MAASTPAQGDEVQSSRMIRPIRDLAAVADALVCLSRLSALALLGEQRMRDQRARSGEALNWMDRAVALADFLEQRGVPPTPVAWPAAVRPDRRGLIGEGPVNVAQVRALRDEIARSIAPRVASLSAFARSRPDWAPVLLQLRDLAATLAAAPERGSMPLLRLRRPELKEVVRPFRGPREVHLDPIFVPTFSLLQDSRTALSLGETDSSPHLWCLSIREAMAAELCALSLVEYDGLPLAFYRDFAKQAWDEMGHALFFLDCSLELLPAFAASARRDHPMMAGIRRYFATGRGLAVPLERNLYEVAWNATLPQRLILMHLDAEAPGLGVFERRLRSRFWKDHPALHSGLAATTREEASHVRIGARWIDHLLPDAGERRRVIHQTMLLRGVLLLAAASHYHRVPLLELMTSLGASGALGQARLEAGDAGNARTRQARA
jgi:hypothetical protein